MDNNSKGTLFIVLGIALFIAFTGRFFLLVIGAIVSLIIINYGLQLKGMPGLLITVKSWIQQLWKLRP